MNKKVFLSTLSNFIEIQCASFCWFLLYGIIEIFLLFPSLIRLTKHLIINFYTSSFFLISPLLLNEKIKKFNKPYTIKLYLPTSFLYKNFRKYSKIALLGEIPLMTDYGTFLINGYEKVIINQLLRNPGLYYQKKIINNKTFFSATLIPKNGIWLHFLFKNFNELQISFNKKEKFNFWTIFTLLKLKTYHFKNKNLLIEKKNELKQKFSKYLFNSNSYNLGNICRLNLQKKLNISLKINQTKITYFEIFKIIENLIKGQTQISKFDDLDHLKNKHIKAIGDLIQFQLFINLKKLIRINTKKISLSLKFITMDNILNPKSFISILNNFFTSSELAQFVDQTNSLADLTHRRRLTVLGTGGFNINRIPLKIHDVHPSYFGYICPIETPEGSNAGLISSFATYGRINSYGFIETPFYRIKNGSILKTKVIIYLTTSEEEQFKIIPADTVLNSFGQIIQKFIIVRYQQKFYITSRNNVDLIPVSTIQFLSLTIALVPFLEHNDAIRSLMGANMQRQAIPLLYPNKPIIGTSLEMQLALDSSTIIFSYSDGFCLQITGTSLIIQTVKANCIKYILQKFIRSNQNTCINQRAIIWPGESIKKGQIIADGSTTENGELAVGQNLTIAYMPWHGFNYEDAVLINNQLIHNDLFTSIHIEYYTISLQHTNSSIDYLTKNLPLINPIFLINLDKNGFIKPGIFVQPGDYLVSKITIKTNAYYKNPLLLEFLIKSKISIINTSIFTLPGSYGRILDIIIINLHKNFNFSNIILIKIFIAQIQKLQVGDKIAGRHGNKGIISKILESYDMPFLPNGKSIDLILNPLGIPSRMNVGQLFEGLLGFAIENLNNCIKILPFDEMYHKNSSRILITKYLKKAKYFSQNHWIFNSKNPGKIILRNGQTGINFDNPITICTSYIFKLIHFIDAKLTARTTGPYSLISQQPVHGKKLSGGQRFGEMEVWALEAFGASYTLYEMLTIKSDSILPRTDVESSIRNNTSLPAYGMPATFQNLILELAALGVNIKTYKIKFFSTNKLICLKNNFFKKQKQKLLIPTYT